MNLETFRTLDYADLAHHTPVFPPNETRNGYFYLVVLTNNATGLASYQLLDHSAILDRLNRLPTHTIECYVLRRVTEYIYENLDTSQARQTDEQCLYCNNYFPLFELCQDLDSNHVCMDCARSLSDIEKEKSEDDFTRSCQP